MIEALDRVMPTFDPDIAKLAARNLIDGREIDARAGVLAKSIKPGCPVQIELVDMIVEHLTENGVMDAGRLYESPYTDLNPLGVDGLFPPAAVEEVFAILDEVRRTAAA